MGNPLKACREFESGFPLRACQPAASLKRRTPTLRRQRLAGSGGFEGVARPKFLRPQNRLIDLRYSPVSRVLAGSGAKRPQNRLTSSALKTD